MKVIESDLPDVLLIEPEVRGDARGYFMETWNVARYEQAGLSARFVQDNVSYSARGTLRGLHFQNPNAQGKLVYVLQGEVFDVAVDIRVGSPTFGRWTGITLSGDNKRQVYIPEGFAHGFCVTSEHALLAYKCTDFYNPEAEASVLWNDPDIGIDWPVRLPILSDRDKNAPRLKDMPPDRLPKFP
ncbi:MAG: dTDP-4-dehydrorhamnose 3,5-epimerase [Anaerolineae bacterium]